MQIQSVSPFECTPSPLNSHVFAHNSTTISSLAYQPIINLPCNRNPIHGFCISLKWVSKKRASSTSHDGLVGVRCGKLEDRDDGFYMRRCVEIARRAIGCTSPNPMVGCVIVRDSKVVGEGFHPKAGQPHAEVFALRDAGGLAEGATAYVSLEPCNHYGRTPPCTEALIKAKVKRVVVGMVDPNPIVASKGVDRLRGAGISVTIGVEEELCNKLNEAYIHKMLTGKPFLALRYSLSVNGCFLDHLGEGGLQSGGYYSKLLQEYDAIIISSTLSENLSSIASNETGANQPIRIIVASSPQQSSIQFPDPTEESASKVVLFTDKETNGEADQGKKGIETVVLDYVDLESVLEYCQQRGLCSVLLDLRGNDSNLEALLEEGLGKNLLKKIIVEVLPVWTASNNEHLAASLNGLVETVRVKKLLAKNSDQGIVLEGCL